MQERQKSGFFDLPGWHAPCTHSHHAPPSYINIPPGKGYRHVCPACGATTEIVHTPAVVGTTRIALL